MRPGRRAPQENRCCGAGLVPFHWVEPANGTRLAMSVLPKNDPSKPKPEHVASCLAQSQKASAICNTSLTRQKRNGNFNNGVSCPMKFYQRLRKRASRLEV